MTSGTALWPAPAHPFAIGILALVAVGDPAAAIAGEKTSVAVLEIQAKSGITKDLTDPLADLVANSIRSLGSYSVIAKADIEAMLGMQKLKDSIGCDDVTCFAELGGALGVQYLVAGNLARVGKALLLNLRLVDARAAKVATGISRKIEGEDDALLDQIPSAVAELFGAPGASNATLTTASGAGPLLARAEEQRTQLEQRLGRILVAEYQEYVGSPAPGAGISFLDVRQDAAASRRAWGIGLLGFGAIAAVADIATLVAGIIQGYATSPKPLMITGGLTVAALGSLGGGYWLYSRGSSELDAVRDLLGTSAQP